MTTWADVAVAFKRDESGATAIEYALIAGIIGLGIVAVLIAVRGDLSAVFVDVAAGFNA